MADVETRIAHRFGTLERINRNEDMRRLREMVREQGVQQIVVGLPLRLDGTQGDMAEEVTRFAERVRKQIGVPVEMVDERLTSWEAERIAGRRTQAANSCIDETHLGRKRTSRAADTKYDCRCGGRGGDPEGISGSRQRPRAEGARIACEVDLSGAIADF